MSQNATNNPSSHSSAMITAYSEVNTSLATTAMTIPPTTMSQKIHWYVPVPSPVLPDSLRLLDPAVGGRSEPVGAGQA